MILGGEGEIPPGIWLTHPPTHLLDTLRGGGGSQSNFRKKFHPSVSTWSLMQIVQAVLSDLVVRVGLKQMEGIR